MQKNKGVHFYVNIMNLSDVIKAEESVDDDLKRTLHRLQTYFVGHTKLIKKYNGEIEKYTSGRCHSVFKTTDDSDNESFYEMILKSVVACFIFNNDIFNVLTKYSQYKKFNLHAGIDCGEYFDYDIDSDEYTTIGGVANNSAKIQSYAPKNNIFITQRFFDKLSKTLQAYFVELTEDEKEPFNQKIRSNTFYKAHYNEMFDENIMKEIEDDLQDIKKRVEEESQSLNIKDIIFESCKKQLSFEGLSLSGKNKILDESHVLCADLRDFTKLFFVSEQNLSDLVFVMAKIYEIMGDTIDDTQATKVQYQGDRIVAVYHDFDNAEEDSLLRIIKSAFTLNSKVRNLNEDNEIQKKLNNKKISIGIGCAFGKTIATRLGLKKNKQNMILSDAYKVANICEDKYAGSNETVICKNMKDKINTLASEQEKPEYMALQELFQSISTTGFYKSTATIEDFENKVKEKEELQQQENKLFNATILKNNEGENSNTNVRPWGL